MPHKSGMFEQFYNVRHLVSPFNDVLTLEEVQKTLKIMREKGSVHEEFLPRFTMFEQNLNGVRSEISGSGCQ